MIMKRRVYGSKIIMSKKKGVCFCAVVHKIQPESVDISHDMHIDTLRRNANNTKEYQQ